MDNSDQFFKVKLDPILDFPDLWIDEKTLAYFNQQRDNIYSSSSKYDVYALKSLKS